MDRKIDRILLAIAQWKNDRNIGNSGEDAEENEEIKRRNDKVLEKKGKEHKILVDLGDKAKGTDKYSSASYMHNYRISWTRN